MGQRGLGFDASIDGADINGSTTATNSATATTTTTIHPPSSGILVTSTFTHTQSATINSKIDELGFAGPTIGWAFGPNWQIYGTGGLGWAHIEDSANWTDTSVCTNSPANTSTSTCGGVGPFNFTDPFSASGGLSMFGWAAGGGVNYKWQIDPGSAVVFGVKYLHYGFGNNTFTLADNVIDGHNVGGTGGSFAINTNEKVDVVTGRISYLFSIH
jgi:opacity protein-like surface antigen